MIKKLKNKMYQYINKYGLNSEKTLKVSQNLDKELNKYYENSNMKYFYNQSKNGLLKYFNCHANFPDINEWNTYAKENNFLSAESIQYISGKNFEWWCSYIIKQK